MWENVFSRLLHDPVSVYLLVGSVLATIAVGLGIIWEHGPPDVQAGANRFVIGGIIVETLCTVLLFAYDANIIGAQNDKIIGLETRIAPRILTAEQFDIIHALHGEVSAVSVLSSPEVEPAMFSAQLQQALVDVNIGVTPIPARPGDRFVGTQICLPDNENPKDSPLWKALSEIGPEPGSCSTRDVALPIPRDVPLIIVGERPPFFPNGAPKSLRMLSYPGYQGAPITSPPPK